MSKELCYVEQRGDYTVESRKGSFMQHPADATPDEIAQRIIVDWANENHSTLGSLPLDTELRLIDSTKVPLVVTELGRWTLLDLMEGCSPQREIIEQTVVADTDFEPDFEISDELREYIEAEGHPVGHLCLSTLASIFEYNLDEEALADDDLYHVVLGLIECYGEDAVV